MPFHYLWKKNGLFRFIVGKNDSSLLGEQQFICVFLSLVKSKLSCSRGHMVTIQTHFMRNIFQEKSTIVMGIYDCLYSLLKEGKKKKKFHELIEWSSQIVSSFLFSSFSTDFIEYILLP